MADIASYNFTIKGSNWQPLSDIMDAYYDHTAAFIMYVNEISAGALGYTHRMVTPEPNDKGRELKGGAEIEIPADSGDYIYLRATDKPVNVEIREKL